MDKLEELREIIENELSEYLGHIGAKDKCIEIIDNIIANS